MLRADLHMHTKFSLDGEFEVEEIVKASQKAGLGIISITDHNLVKGVPEALECSLAYGVKVIPGIEIDCQYKGIDLHVLGYNINWGSNDFTDLENSVTQKVMDSFPAMVDKLSRAGIDVDADEVLLKAEGKLPSGELIAEVLLGNSLYQDNKKLIPYRTGGERSDMPYINFYHDYFAQGKPAYVKIDYMDYQAAIALIKSNLGVPVIAHPGLNLKGREEIIEDLLDKGAEGLEAFNNYHDYDQIAYFTNVARKRNVLVTCGSDFHGKNKPLIKPGIYRTISQFEDYVIKSTEKLFI